MVDFMPYAQALFEVATEAQKDVSIGQEIQELAEVWSSNQELVQVFKHPKVKREEKKELLQKILGENVDPILFRFLLVLNQHDVLGYLPEIAAAYTKCFNKAHAIEIVDVESASELDAKQIQDLESVLAKKLKKTVRLNVKVNPDLIAGLRVHTSEFVLDNTVLTRANSMKEQIKKNQR